MNRVEGGTEATRSVDLPAELLGWFREILPEVVTETGAGAVIDVQVLQELLHGKVTDEASERYGINWHGKWRSRQIALKPSTGTLRPRPEDSVDWETTQNLLIEGDNLEVLKLLQKGYCGRVNVIYIDPPYNTGKEFVYPDAFQDNIKAYLSRTGQALDNGDRLTSNTEASGRFHTDWLSMMYPRLKLARILLAEDGIIFISMDDHEHHTLRFLCDEIFGEECFIGNLSWFTTTQPDNIGRARFGVQQNIEYVLAYSKCARLDLPPFKLESKGQKKSYPHTGRLGACRFQIIERAFEGAYARPTMRYKILGQPPRDGKQWQIGEAQARDLEARGRLEIVDGMVKRAIYPEDETEDSESFEPFWANMRNVETSQRGKAELTRLLGAGHGVDTVKPVSLIAELLSHLPSNALVLDFFAGSGTTGQAVLELNAKDKGKRRFILVQLPLPLADDQQEQRSSAEYCDSISKPRRLSEITKERLRRVGAGVERGTGRDVGFRVFHLDSSNLREWDDTTKDLEGELALHTEHVKEGRSESDLLFELVLKLGLDLCVPMEQRTIVAGSTQHVVTSVGFGVVLTCLSTRIAVADVESLALGIANWHRELAPAGDSTCVFRDSAFDNDVAKSNMSAILNQNGILVVRSL